MRYVMMRLLLASRHEGTLLAGIPRVTRQAYIRQIFGTEIRSEHYGSSFVFEPFPSPTEDKIIGANLLIMTFRAGGLQIFLLTRPAVTTAKKLQCKAH